jgi:dihydrolipoamide dehydrogenase
MGAAKLIAKDTIAVEDADGNTTEIKAKNVVIATGASPFVLPGVEVDGKKVLTYEEAILQTHLPSSVVIVGSGAIGVEFATIWNAYGVDVTLVEMLPRIVPNEDEEISTELAKAFSKNKIKMLTNTRVEGIETTDDGVKITASGEAGELELEAEQVMLAISFKPNTVGLGLENVGIQLTDGGAIEIDERMATNVPGIWAIGDVTAKLMLAHVGSAQGIICAENIAGAQTITLDYEMLPRATYCQPQIASFGITKETAEERGFEVKVGRFPFQANGKALGLGDYAGWVKIITDKKYGEILGASMIGPEVTELLPELTLAQMMELTPAEIGRNVHAHPTLSEVLMEAAHDAEGHAVHI